MKSGHIDWAVRTFRDVENFIAAVALFTLLGNTPAGHAFLVHGAFISGILV